MNTGSIKRSRVPVAVVAALASAALAVAMPGLHHDAQGHSEASHVAQNGDVTSKQAAFHDAMRKLWEDHVTWTRLFIVSAAADLPDLDATANRLLKNQVHIGNAIKPFYGKAAGKQLTKLLQDHILIAGDIIGSAKAGDDAGVETNTKRWYKNANQIADFLSTANPDNWHRKEMRSMMREHLDLTLAEAVAQLEGRYGDSVRTYDKIHRQILGMSDMLSDGIVAQFPGRFR